MCIRDSITAADGTYEQTLKSEMAKSEAPTLFQVNGPVGLANWKDYIKNPKPGGYRSLHLIIEVPIFLEKEKRPMKVEVDVYKRQVTKSIDTNEVRRLFWVNLSFLEYR